MFRYKALAVALHPDRQRAQVARSAAEARSRGGAVDVEALRAAATAAFRRVCEAHEVLTDPGRRAVYDVHGLRGVRAGLQLGPRLGTAEELRAELERRRAARAERRAAMALSGRYVVELDASHMVRCPDVRNASPEVLAMAATQSMEVPLAGNKDVLMFQGHVKERLDGVESTTTGAHFIVSWHRVLDAATYVVGRLCVLSNGLGWELSSGRSVTAHDRLEVTAEGTLDPGTVVDALSGYDREAAAEALPMLAVSWERRLFEGWLSRVRYSCPQATRGPELTTELHRTWENASLALTWTQSLLQNMWSAKVNRAIDSLTGCFVKATYGWNVSLMPPLDRAQTAGLETRITRKVGKLSKVGLGVTLASGVQLSVHVSHANQQVAIPILLTPTLGLREALWGLAAPHALLGAAWTLVVKPLAVRARRRRQLRARHANAGKVRAARARAAASARVLSAPAARRRRAEERSGGLVILEATYGNLQAMDDLRRAEAGERAGRQQSGEGDDAGEGRGGETDEDDARSEASAGDAGDAGGARISELSDAERAAVEDFAAAEGLPTPWFDVTAATQFMVEGSRLVLGAKVRKAGMMGFCDPCPGEGKQLRVRYAYKGAEAVAVFGDDEAVVLPPGASSPDGSKWPPSATPSAARPSAQAGSPDVMYGGGYFRD